MTNTIASNTVNQSMNVMNNVITSTSNQCSTTINTGVYNIVLGGNSVNCNVDQDSNVTVSTDMSCVASTTVQNDILNNLTQSAMQQAEAINQQFGLLSFSEAINVTNGYLSLANNMNTAFYNSCVTEITSNEVNVVSCGGSTNFNVDLDYDNTIKNTQNCIFNNSSVTTTSNNITQSVAQSAKAVIQNYLAGIIFAIALVIVGAGIVLFLILIIMKAGGKKNEPIIAGGGGDSGLTNTGDDVIALAATLTGKEPNKLPPTIVGNPLSVAIK